jgi:hypothetical protein
VHEKITKVGPIHKKLIEKSVGTLEEKAHEIDPSTANTLFQTLHVCSLIHFSASQIAYAAVPRKLILICYL